LRVTLCTPEARAKATVAIGRSARMMPYGLSRTLARQIGDWSPEGHTEWQCRLLSRWTEILKYCAASVYDGEADSDDSDRNKTRRAVGEMYQMLRT
jgi:hypothetical protein